MKIDYIRKKLAVNIIYQKNILGLGWPIPHGVKDFGFSCILQLYCLFHRAFNIYMINHPTNAINL